MPQTIPNWNYRVVAEAFQAEALPPRKVHIKTISVHMRAEMAATGRFVTTFPQSALLLHADRLKLKTLAVDLPLQNWPIFAVTSKDRTLSPVVERFLECTRSVGHLLARQVSENIDIHDLSASP